MEVAAVAVPIDDQSRIGDARRQASALAREQHFSEADESRVAIVATELATNLHRHASRDRWLLARALNTGESAEIELIGIDRGPGIGDLGEAERDGYSTAGTAGEGIGAMRRLADVLDLHTTPLGTVVLARVGRERRTSADPIGAIRIPKPGEEECGDAWCAEVDGDATTVLVADGLGHGYLAAEASAAAVESFSRTGGFPLAERTRLMHEALTRTRGAAVAMARVDAAQRRLTYCGLGNISGVVVTDGSTRSLVSHHGTAGKVAPRITEFSYEFPPRSRLIMHSDGLSARWDLRHYVGVWQRHPSLLAGILFRDHGRSRDDACAVVFAPQD